MSRALPQTALLVLALILLLPPAATAQKQKIGSSQAADPKNPKAEKPTAQLPLQSVTLVSTEEAARQAAEEVRARAQPSKAGPGNPKQAEPGKAADRAVLEFHPADSLPGADVPRGGFQENDSKKSVLKNIHGSAYGSAASATGRANSEGGAVGADSRGGKVNIYVEGERGRASTPDPH
ncbi:MAG: hypothetical protein EPN47_14260 [Acidobacteria bacterium]|nr:MAG: hypothetical protein EPN47_14260 [Acidobacteriota bacterium]